MPDQIPILVDETVRARFVVENRTAAPADLAYLDRATARACRLQVAPGEAGALDGDPTEVRWLNAPDMPPAFLAAEEADAIDAAHTPGSAPWAGLAYRLEAALPAEASGR